MKAVCLRKNGADISDPTVHYGISTVKTANQLFLFKTQLFKVFFFCKLNKVVYRKHWSFIEAK